MLPNSVCVPLFIYLFYLKKNKFYCNSTAYKAIIYSCVLPDVTNRNVMKVRTDTSAVKDVY